MNERSVQADARALPLPSDDRAASESVPARWPDCLAAIGITRGLLALCLLWLVAAGPIVQDLTAQAAPRMALTGALVDDHDVDIDGYLVGVDFAERDGRIYSDKAPGQEVLAIPAYRASTAVGAEKAIVPRVRSNLTLWWVTFWSAGLPALAIMAMVAAAARRRGTPIALPALATLAFGTMLLPFSVNLYSHVLGAALGFGAWLVLDRVGAGARIGWHRGAAAGALIGLAVTVEYPLAIEGVVLVGLLVARRSWTALAAFVAAGVPFVGFLAVYQNAAFGSPFSSGYSGKSYHQGATLLVTGVPKLTTLAEVLLGSRGLLVFTPVVGVGLYGLVRRWREDRDDGALVAIAVAAGFLLLQAGWANPWGGEMPGPRYTIAALPFLGLGLAKAWTDLSPLLRRVVAGISLVSMILPAITYHLLGDGSMLIAGSLDQLRRTGLNPTVWSIALGPIGSVLYAASVGAAAWWLRKAARAESPAAPAEPAPVSI